MNIEVRAPQREQKIKLQIVDCDFHPKITHDQMRPFLSNQWWSYLQTYGNRSRHGYAKGYAYPKMHAAGRAPRRLAAERRLAGERPRFHAAAASRFLRHRVPRS